jgi:hypothetical protein
MNKNQIQWPIVIVALVVATGAMTWSRVVSERKSLLPHAEALLEITKLHNAQAQPEVDALLVKRLEVMSDCLRGRGTGLPFPPRDALTIADNIDAYLESTTTGTVEHVAEPYK